MAEPSSSTATSTSSPSSSSQRLQGPRPAPLRVRRDSHRIRKSPVQQVRQPVIIYTVSPKVVHAEPSEFRSVVQRLTGAAAASSSSSLPAPPPADVDTTHQFPFFVPSSSLPPPPQFQLHQQAAAAADHAPPLPSSILSPVPGSLPAVPASFFSPPAAGINLFGESPAFLGGATTTTSGGGASQIYPALPSPPGAYYWDLFNNQHNP